MKQTSIKTNFIYNILYQILIIIVPLITSPYLTRIIGAEGLGIYTFTQSYAHYFVLFIMLGINNYGNREIAKARDAKDKTNKVFSEVFCIQLFMLIVLSLMYLMSLIFIVKENKIIYWIQFFYVISAGFDINWCCFGLEKFKLTVTRNSIVKILGAVLIFLLVKGQDDLWIYALIMTLSALVSQLIVWPFILKEVNFVKIDFNNVKERIRPILKLFLPVIAVSLYNIMDKLMLGLFSSKAEVGFYTYSEQIISIPRSFISALGTVMLPRAANLIQNGKERENISLLNRSMQLAMLICMASTFGVISISNVFIPWYYGELFRRCVLFTILLSPTVIFAGWNNVIRTQFVIPRSLDNIYLVTVSTGALTNLLLNLVLIPHFDGTGAIIATVFAEFSVCFAQFLLLKKKLSYKPFLGDAFVFLLFGVIMLAALLFIPELFKIKIIEIIFRIFLGALIFVGLSFVYLYSFKKDYFYFDYIKLVSRKFSKTK